MVSRSEVAQSSPKVIVQIAIAGAQILGRAFAAAGKQAVASMFLSHLWGVAEFNVFTQMQSTDQRLAAPTRLECKQQHLVH